jgi:hypothetical protein
MPDDHMPIPAEEYPDQPVIDEDSKRQWVQYLNAWERDVYGPLFKPRGISRDAALTCWFVNRLRNAIPDDDVGNDPSEQWRSP